MSTDHVSGEKPSLGQWQEKTKVNNKSKTKATSWVVTDTINLLAKFLLGLSGFFFLPTMSLPGLGHEPIRMHIAANFSCHEWFGSRPVFRFSSVKHVFQSAWGRLCFCHRRSCH